MLSFHLNAEIEQLRKEDAWKAGRNSNTLVKYPEARAVLTVLKAGTRLHEHRAAGRNFRANCGGAIQMHAKASNLICPQDICLRLSEESHTMSRLLRIALSTDDSAAGRHF